MRARLLVESGIASPRVCDLNENAVVLLGRNRDNTILLQDRRASRSHARISFHDGAYHIVHQGETTNGTRIDGQELDGEVALNDGQVIAIGDVRIRFVVPTDESMPVCPPRLDDSDATLFQADEMTVLFRFLNDSQVEMTPARLVGLALESVRRQTGADLAGYLGLDADPPDLRLVVPPLANVDTRLSTRLTQRVQREGRTVWLAGPAADRVESDSLSDIHDAVCVPLRSGCEPPLGALHVYKNCRTFTHGQVRFCEVLAGCLASSLHLLRGRRALEADNRRLREHSARSDDMVGDSRVMGRLKQLVRQMADGPCTVLIQGESGVGKELVALGLHSRSARHDGPLVTVNCAAISQSLAESELFGHVKGAFSGALRDHDGYFAQADMGTLFLDEIGDLSLDLQAKLLRAIEYRAFRPVGARGESSADVRVLAATNRDLETEVRAGRFRRDLFYRLTARITVPPLREHAEDIPALVAHFLDLFAVEYRRRVELSEGAIERLMAFHWPGNVRQLRSVLEGAVAMTADGAVIHAGDLNLVHDPLLEPPRDGPPSLNLEELEQWAIRHALVQTNGVATQAARLLGIHRETLGIKMRTYGIDRP